MEATVVIVNDMSQMTDYITERKPRMVEEFAGRVMGLIDDMIAAGFHEDRIGMIFTDDGSQFKIGNPTPPNEYLVHFALLELDCDGHPKGVFKAIVIDLKLETIGDIQLTKVH